jgi:hypothetical protein
VQISNQRIHEYQKIYMQRFGTNLTFDQAKKQSAELLNLMQSVFQPINRMPEKGNVFYQNEYENQTKQSTNN